MGAACHVTGYWEAPQPAPLSPGSASATYPADDVQQSRSDEGVWVWDRHSAGIKQQMGIEQTYSSAGSKCQQQKHGASKGHQFEKVVGWNNTSAAHISCHKVIIPVPASLGTYKRCHIFFTSLQLKGKNKWALIGSSAHSNILQKFRVDARILNLVSKIKSDNIWSPFDQKWLKTAKIG